MTASKKRTLLVGIVIATLVCVTIFALAAFSGGSAGGTLASGRSVITSSDGLTLTSSFSADTATIKTAGYTIVVGPTDVSINGRTVAQIEESVADVKVHVENGTVQFEADGRPVPYRGK